MWLPLVTLAQATSFITLLIFSLIHLPLWRIKRRGGSAPVVAVPVPALGFVGCVAMLGFRVWEAVGTP